MSLDPRRREYLTGTDMCILAGVYPESWGTPHDVWLHKVEGVEPDVEETESMEWGKRLEGAVAQKFYDNHPEIVYTSDNAFWANGIFGGTFDRTYEDPIGLQHGLEIKTTSDEPWDYPPDRVLVQVHTYMLANPNLSSWTVAALFSGRKYREYQIVRDDNLLDQLTEIGQEFWINKVVLNQAPPDQAVAPCVVIDDGSVLDADQSDELRELMETYELACKGDPVYLPRKAELAEQIKACYGTHRRITFDGKYLDYITVTPKADVDYPRAFKWLSERADVEHVNNAVRLFTITPKPYRRLGTIQVIK